MSASAARLLAEQRRQHRNAEVHLRTPELGFASVLRQAPLGDIELDMIFTRHVPFLSFIGGFITS